MAEPRFRFVAPDGRRGPWRTSRWRAIVSAVSQHFGPGRGRRRHPVLVSLLFQDLSDAGWRIEAGAPAAADDG